ncbi:hypothetical protein AB6A40_010063 [Gnathostoma spinigerum]|uniref:Major facilitator superfamily (MFS) profile domain-containing protein n=1 Tax=Gnathostoma spinigerum TaxID=75299 RepID=A0ABD6ETQ4_9BILA
MADECDKSKGDQIQDKSTAEEDNVECKLENAGIIVPPDGGYGWVVVAASFLANVLVDGIIFTTGQSLLGIWEKDFQTTAMAASWAQSLLGGCYLIAGPLAGAFANHFGCRIVTITGALLAFTGFVLSALVPALPILYLTFGIVGGIGFGLIYLPAIVIVSQYFDKRRALATGLAVCGSGIGTTLFSQINPFLLNLHKNNWRFFLVNIAFIILLNIVCGICFKALKPNETQVEKVAEIASEYHERQKEFREHIMGAGKVSSILPSLFLHFASVEVNSMESIFELVFFDAAGY